jgi:hypothetical protein
MTFDYPVLLFCFLIFIPIFIFDIIKQKKTKKLSLKLKNKLRYSVFLFRLFLVFIILRWQAQDGEWGMRALSSGAVLI